MIEHIQEGHKWACGCKIIWEDGKIIFRQMCGNCKEVRHDC
jgi:hypothetical protein